VKRARRASSLAILRAIVVGLLVAMPAANIWPLLLVKLGTRAAASLEIVFLGLFLWWTSGAGPPARLRPLRTDYFRRARPSAPEWRWGLLAALSFAVTVHAAIILLFRFEPFPAQAFHRGYDFSFIPTQSLRWLACIVSALSAAVCEETGFRGYMQRPIESMGRPRLAILISSVFFTLVHLEKSWSLLLMVPIVFGAGALLGWLARASGTLLFGMLGHWIMDIGLFAYWWTQIAGTFTAQPVWQTGWDRAFAIEWALFAVALAALIIAILQLAKLSAGGDQRPWKDAISIH
jgi:membrane protease YdiL (CAAX protease family)